MFALERQIIGDALTTTASVNQVKKSAQSILFSSLSCFETYKDVTSFVYRLFHFFYIIYKV